MATLLALKSKIRTAKNVSKTTKAMQMIAASKLKRAQEAALSSRPYADKLSAVSKGLLFKLEEENYHEYMKASSKSKKTLLIVFAPEKGLCGALTTNVANELMKQAKEKREELFVVGIGKKIQYSLKSLQTEAIASFDLGTGVPTFDMVYPILQIVDDYFLNEKVSSVQILFPKFSSLFVQSPQIETLLPVEIPKEPLKVSGFTLFEPKAPKIIPTLLRHYIEILLHQYLIETYLSEQAARTLSMKNATENAGEIIESLQLEYNKSRQERITSELLDSSAVDMEYAN
ncbi:MAG: ATP synthase F1 subunit gamma [Candidatus Levybacteria bacterium]|nr:ATP synthase F1 subunit gamma [Candidatus Levybacteria bacterium]